MIISLAKEIGYYHIAAGLLVGTDVTAQITPPPLDWTIPGYSLYYNTLGIVWELPDYTPVYTLGAPRVYPTSPDYTPPDSGWGIVWAIGVYSGIYHIGLTINYRYNI